MTLTPMLMFGAITRAMCCAWVVTMACCAAVKPVVPMTTLTPKVWHTAKWASVPSGRVKSINTSAPCKPLRKSAVTKTPVSRPKKAAASWPMAALPGASSAPLSVQSALFKMASTNIRPMRPELPATAIFMNRASRTLKRWVLTHRACRFGRRLGLFHRDGQGLALVFAEFELLCTQVFEAADRGHKFAL